MSKPKSPINLILYIITLVVAIILVYNAFTIGLHKGKFEGTYYPPEKKAAAEGEDKKPVDLRKLRIATPELVNEGAKLFKLNCASCHGDDGHGDGPKAASLNPHPRNFVEEKFKYGASPLQIYHTLTNGIQGTSMPAFDLLPAEERMAMAHYVRTFVPDPPDDPQELVDALPVVDESGGETTAAAPDSTAADSTKPKVEPISLEKARAIVLAQQTSAAHVAGPINTNYLFIRYCASCHGDQGQGKVRPEQAVPSSVIYLKVGNLVGRQSKTMTDKASLEKFLTAGTYGMTDHRFGFLTAKQIDELNRYLRYLSNLTR